PSANRASLNPSRASSSEGCSAICEIPIVTGSTSPPESPLAPSSPPHAAKKSPAEASSALIRQVWEFLIFFHRFPVNACGRFRAIERTYLCGATVFEVNLPVFLRYIHVLVSLSHIVRRAGVRFCFYTASAGLKSVRSSALNESSMARRAVFTDAA